MRNKIGVKSVTVTIEAQRESYVGTLAVMLLNKEGTDLEAVTMTDWTGDIFGQYAIESVNS